MYKQVHKHSHIHRPKDIQTVALKHTDTYTGHQNRLGRLILHSNYMRLSSMQGIYNFSVFFLQLWSFTDLFASIGNPIASVTAPNTFYVLVAFFLLHSPFSILLHYYLFGCNWSFFCLCCLHALTYRSEMSSNRFVFLQNRNCLITDKIHGSYYGSY